MSDSKPHITPDDVLDEIERRLRECRAENERLEEQLRSREDALREVYELIAIGEPDNALHGLDAYLIREGIYRGEAASSPASELPPRPSYQPKYGDVPAPLSNQERKPK